MPSLPHDSPAARLETGFPVVKGNPSDCLGFYVTTYEASYGRRPPGSPQNLERGRVLGFEPPGEREMRPLLGAHTGSGYVTNNYAAVASLINPYVERDDTDISTTAEDFKLFAHPEYRRILPSCVDELECRYPAGFSFSRLRFGEARVPKAPGERGASPAQPDVPQRMTELSGFAGTAPRSDLTLPEQPMSPVPMVSPVPTTPQHPGVTSLSQLDFIDGQMDSFPFKCTPSPQPGMGHCPPFAPPELQVGPKGVTTRREPLSYATIHNKYLTQLSPLAPIAPGWWAQAPITCAPRSVEGIQIPSPSGFSTNNHPTSLWRIDEPMT